jgi:hypothetical protein
MQPSTLDMQASVPRLHKKRSGNSFGGSLACAEDRQALYARELSDLPGGVLAAHVDLDKVHLLLLSTAWFACHASVHPRYLGRILMH